jgi:hypothetical protein
MPGLSALLNPPGYYPAQFSWQPPVQGAQAASSVMRSDPGTSDDSGYPNAQIKNHSSPQQTQIGPYAYASQLGAPMRTYNSASTYRAMNDDPKSSSDERTANSGAEEQPNLEGAPTTAVKTEEEAPDPEGGGIKAPMVAAKEVSREANPDPTDPIKQEQVVDAPANVEPAQEELTKQVGGVPV